MEEGRTREDLFVIQAFGEKSFLSHRVRERIKRKLHTRARHSRGAANFFGYA